MTKQNDARPQQILKLAVAAGETLLQSGGEVFRVQQTMQIIANAYGAKDFHVYVLTNGIFASLRDGEGVSTSEVRNVRGSGRNLGHIIAVNELSRSIAAGKVTMEQALQRIEEIAQMPPLAVWLRIVACGVGCACFAWLLGGHVQDALAAFVVGVLLEPLSIWLGKTTANTFISNLVCAVWVAALSAVTVRLCAMVGVQCNIDKVIIGSIMPLVPGIALTTAVWDITNSDYLSGTIRAVEALLIGVAIAVGVGLVLMGVVPLLGVVL
jgi:uncharacterized membrane protein YjjP (DUF1212 family)